MLSNTMVYALLFVFFLLLFVVLYKRHQLLGVFRP